MTEKRSYIISASIPFFAICFVISCGNPVSHPEEKPIEYPSVYGFMELAEIEQGLRSMEKKYRSIIEVPIKQGITNEKRDIYIVKLSDNVDSDEDEPVGVFIAGQHAREWMSIAVLYYILEQLAAQYQTNTEIKTVIDSMELWFIPVVNPDGYVYSHSTDRLWRKNRRDNGDNSFGVDLNRNWGYKWGDNDDGSSPDTGSQTYRGTEAFSEPEIETIKTLLENNNPSFFIDYHSYSQLVLYPYGYAQVKIDSSSSDYTIYNENITVAELYAKKVHEIHKETYKPQTSWSLYPNNGSSVDYVFHVYKIPSLTIELRPNTTDPGFEVPESEIKPTVEENLAAFLACVKYILDSK